MSRISKCALHYYSMQKSKNTAQCTVDMKELSVLICYRCCALHIDWIAYCVL